MNQRIDYALPMYHYGSVVVPLDATTEEIHKAIDNDLPKHVTLRVAMGAGDDAEIISMEFVDDEVTA